MAKKKAATPKRVTTSKKATTPKSPRAKAASSDRPKCGLCGKTKRLTKTECCDRWICDDEDNYVMFSYARNSCHRNHHRYTICALHSIEGHDGRWQDCAKCREYVEPEMYVYFATNEYNFEILENPPAYEPTTCRSCGKGIRLAMDGYAQSSEGYSCLKYANKTK